MLYWSCTNISLIYLSVQFRDVTITAIARQRSGPLTLKFAAVFGLWLWSVGAQRKTIDALYQCGLSISYNSVLNLMQHLSECRLKVARCIALGPHMFGYDNVNVSHSPHVEQRGAQTPQKVLSGTYPMIYELVTHTGAPVNPDHFNLKAIHQRWLLCPELSFQKDLRLTLPTIKSLRQEFTAVITDVLFSHTSSFNKAYTTHPWFLAEPRRPMQRGHKSRYHPLRISVIPEATTGDNLSVHDDVYIGQLDVPMDTLSSRAIITVGDLLTIQRIRAGKSLRRRDVNAWERRDVLQLGLGLFHLVMNLIWALLHVHRGTLAQNSSLTYMFALLEKVRLASEHPDYHALLSALTQTLNGVLLEAWRHVSGYSDLNAFAESKPTPLQILNMATKIINDFTSPMPNAQGLSPSSPDPSKDISHHNLRLLARDLLYVSVLVRAISAGDFGRIEPLLPQLAMLFRGAGSNSYCAEILNFILDLKYVWTPEFAYEHLVLISPVICSNT